MNNIKIEFNGWWGLHSALIKKESMLYKLKMQFINNLINIGIITDNELDERNYTPHIRVTNNNNPQNKIAYDIINNKVINITKKSLKFTDNYVYINTGDSGLIDTHITLIYKKNIGNHKKNIIKLFIKTLDEVLK